MKNKLMDFFDVKRDMIYKINNCYYWIGIDSFEECTDDEINYYLSYEKIIKNNQDEKDNLIIDKDLLNAYAVIAKISNEKSEKKQFKKNKKEFELFIETLNENDLEEIEKQKEIWLKVWCEHTKIIKNDDYNS